MSEITREDLNDLVIEACKGCIDIFRCGFRKGERDDFIKCYSYRKYQVPCNRECVK